MTLSTQKLSDALTRAIKNTDFSNISSNLKTTVDNFDSTKKNIFGSLVGEEVQGIQALSRDVDDSEESGNPSQTPTPTKITPNIPVSELNGNVPSSDATSINSITGTPTAKDNGFLNTIISAGTPEAIAAALSKTAGKTPTEIKSILESLTTSALKDNVLSAINKSPYGKFLSAAVTFKSRLDSIIQKNSGVLLDDMGERIEKEFEKSVNGITDRTVPPSDISTAFDLVSKNDYVNGFKTILPYIDKPNEYETTVNSVDKNLWTPDILTAFNKIQAAQNIFNDIKINISSYVSLNNPALDILGSNTLPIKDINSKEPTSTSVVSTSTTGEKWTFDPIESTEELESMFRNIKRNSGSEIAGATIHWSATFLNQDVDALWIDKIHKSMGFDGCGYHIIIKRNGDLQRGRPLDKIGAHDFNHNKNFLGFCFIGGINENSSNASKPYWKYSSSASLTQAQFKAYDKLMKVFHEVFPNSQVGGHYMTSESGKTDPGFDVVDYSESKFGHNNVIPENDSLWKTKDGITQDAIENYV